MPKTVWQANVGSEGEEDDALFTSKAKCFKWMRDVKEVERKILTLLRSKLKDESATYANVSSEEVFPDEEGEQTFHSIQLRQIL